MPFCIRSLTAKKATAPASRSLRRSSAAVLMDVTADEQAVQDILSYMPQKFGLYEDLTIAENMTLYADLHGVPQDVRQERDIIK